MCVYQSKQRIAQGQRKSTELPEGKRQAEPQEPAFMLIPDHQSRRINIYARAPNFTAALPLPPRQAALRQAHKASSFFLSPKGGEERGPHLPAAIILSFCAWSDSPTWGHLQA